MHEHGVSLRRTGFAKLWWFACSLHMLSERFEQARAFAEGTPACVKHVEDLAGNVQCSLSHAF
jgi:hypothetical protein